MPSSLHNSRANSEEKKEEKEELKVPLPIVGFLDALEGEVMTPRSNRAATFD